MEIFGGPSSGRRRGKIVGELEKDFARTPSENISTILPLLFPTAPACRGSAKYFYNFSTIFPQLFLVWKNLVHPDWLGEEL
jgi:hypothetical protein